MKDARFFGPILLAGFCAAGGLQPPPARGAEPAAAQSTDAQREIAMTLEKYGEAKTDAQRAAIVDFLHHLDRAAVVAAVIDAIAQSRTGKEATGYNELIGDLQPEACAEVIRQLGKTDSAEVKGKLIVALRHCTDPAAVQALGLVLPDQRFVKFEAHGKTPRRVCDLAYDELFLKLRSNPAFGLDPGPHMNGIIRETTPIKARDGLIEKLAGELAESPEGSALPVAPAALPVVSGT